MSGTKRSGYGVATEQDDTEDLDNEDGGAVLPNGTIMVPASASKKQRLGGSGVVGHDSDEEWHNDAVGDAVASDTAVTSSAKHLYILLHNLDGPALRSADAQTALSVLAAAGRIHVAASVDHVNASLLLDQRQRQRGNWVWHDITTYSRYSEETACVYLERCGCSLIACVHSHPCTLVSLAASWSLCSAVEKSSTSTV